MYKTNNRNTIKRRAALLIVIAMLAALIPVMAWPTPALAYAGYTNAYGIDGAVGQDGTVAKPYFISTGQELQNIGKAGGPTGTAGAAADLAAHYVLKADIDLFVDFAVNQTFQPIAPGGNTAACFRGVLDGAGYKISNLYINITATTDANNYGLFANIGGDAKISNLEIETAKVPTAGVNYGVRTAGTGKAAILAGNKNGAYTEGSITNVITRGLVQTGGNGGGLAGTSDGMTISDCTNYADVSASGAPVASGAVTGIAGTSEISDCTNYGYIFAGQRAGGLIGVATPGKTYSGLVNYGDVASGSQPSPVAGGIAGQGDGASFYRCLNYGRLIANHATAINGIGGITNKRDNTAVNPNITVTECLSACKITGISNQTYYGGMVSAPLGITAAGAANITIDKCVVLNNVVTINTSGVFSGLVLGPISSAASTITDTYVGGTYATGINGTQNLAGYLSGFGTIKNCYVNIVNATGTSPLRRIYGENCLVIADGTDIPTANAGDMLLEDTFTTAGTYGLDFDFATTWAIDEGDTLPYLQWTQGAGLDNDPVVNWTYTDTFYTTETPIGSDGAFISNDATVNLKANLLNTEVVAFNSFAMATAGTIYPANLAKAYSPSGIIYSGSFSADFTRSEKPWLWLESTYADMLEEYGLEDKPEGVSDDAWGLYLGLMAEAAGDLIDKPGSTISACDICDAALKVIAERMELEKVVGILLDDILYWYGLKDTLTAPVPAEDALDILALLLRHDALTSAQESALGHLDELFDLDPDHEGMLAELEATLRPLLVGSENGMKDYPYIIHNAYEFRDMYTQAGDYTVGYGPNKYYRLAGNIDMSLITWPTARPALSVVGLEGSGGLDGDGHIIYNITGAQGLFASANRAEFKNLELHGTLSGSTTDSVGMLAGWVSASTIDGVTVLKTSSVNGAGRRGVGGLVGRIIYNDIKTVFENCVNYANVNGLRDIGGILGYGAVAGTANVDFSYCRNYGNI
ncbi:MAG: hypothetical protein FWD16_06340, partial [Clostridia bacterium]|nr:hypothetical protein [Clostridia bacterium]